MDKISWPNPLQTYGFNLPIRAMCHTYVIARVKFCGYEKKTQKLSATRNALTKHVKHNNLKLGDWRMLKSANLEQTIFSYARIC